MKQVHSTSGKRYVPIGNHHQAEIPELMPKSEYCKLQNNMVNDDPLEHDGVIAQETNRDIWYYPTSSITMPWTRKEESYFMAGLYLFNKDFSAVKRFVGSKTMGEILSFYYDQFCKSSEYQRWKDRMTSLGNNSIIFGEKIISEKTLMSRLQPLLTTHAYMEILEMSWLYGESLVTLENYVSVLKNKVGLDNLVEALGIGNKEEEIINTKKSKKNKAPIGNDWASLTQREILYFAGKHSSLSKHQSNDLFWEAVWPRLLAKGWHFEEDRASSSLSLSPSSPPKLLFLVPGIKKFSMKLERGKDYFDSVSEVLRNVASHPELVELVNLNTMGHDLADGATNLS
ncbi:hypothetical protein HN51_017020 [Arachis hypogaea]